MKLLVIGASGQLGTDVVGKARERGWDVVPLTHADLDITDETQVAKCITGERPQAVVNTAAFHNLDACEADPARAFAVNAGGTRLLARSCARVDSILVHLSTDYVFDGAGRTPYIEADVPRPLNVYGVSKLAGEHFLSVECPRAVSVRVSALYGSAPCRAKGGDNFVRLMLRLGRERGEVKVVNDQFVTPTSTTAVGEQICLLLEKEALGGVVHATCQGQCSWYEFAVEIFRLAKLDVAVQPVSSSEFPSPIRRPVFSVLENRRLEEADIDIMPRWQDALGDYLSEIG